MENLVLEGELLPVDDDFEDDDEDDDEIIDAEFEDVPLTKDDEPNPEDK